MVGGEAERQLHMGPQAASILGIPSVPTTRFGAAQIAEIVMQLRGKAGPRQVDGARIGLAHTLGGNTATVVVSLFGRE